MDSTASVYNNPERKRDLIKNLKDLQDFHLEAANTLDKKAWDILSVTSATFGIVSAIVINLITDKTTGLFWIGLLGVLFLYALQVQEVLSAVKPMKWPIVPGVADQDMRYENLMEKFIASSGESISEDEYLNQLIADYAGSLDVNDRKTHRPGTIQRIEDNNQTKATHIQKAARLLGGIIAALIGLGFAASV